MKITITLNMIRVHSPCESGWNKLLKSLGKTKADDEPLTFAQIAESNGIDDALWCLRGLPEEHHAAMRLMAADFAERVLPIFEKFLPNEDRPRKAIEATRQLARGEIDDKAWAAAGGAARDAAGDAAWAAAWAAAGGAARDAAGDAAWAAARDAAGDAAWAAAGGAARDAAGDAAGAAGAAARDAAGAAAWAAAGAAAGAAGAAAWAAAGGAAWAAGDAAGAAGAAARDAARDAERKEQLKLLLKYFGEKQ